MDDPVKNPYISPESIGDQSATGFGSSIRAQVRVGQIITFALIQGTLMIAGIMLYMALAQKRNTPQQANDGDILFLGIGILLAIGACVLALVVSSTMRRLGMEKFRDDCGPDSGSLSPDSAAPPAVNELLTRLQTATLVGQAAMEGAAIANALLLMFDGNMIHVALIAAMLVGIIWQTPTVGKRQAVIEQAVQ